MPKYLRSWGKLVWLIDKTKPCLAIKRLYGPELADIWSSVQCQKTVEGADTLPPLEWLALYLNCQIIKFKVTQVFPQVAYEQEDYYHSVQWLEESVRLFRGTGSKWSPENEGTLQDALDHLAFSHFKVGGRKLGTCTFVRWLMDCIALKSSHCFRQETSPMRSVFLRSYSIMVNLFI